jgi:hypothetical protein
LAEHLPLDAGERPSGHVKKSWGWHNKMTNNPRMNYDQRNQALVGMSDGIPMFRAKHSKGCVPIALRNANLPDSLSQKFRHMHLAALYPCEYWGYSKENRRWERVERQPKTLKAMLYMLVDDLLHWQDGDYVEDVSRELGDPERKFLLRVILLFWCGDYPAQAQVSGFMHGTPNNGMCHWCDIKGCHDVDCNSRVYGGFHRSNNTHTHSRRIGNVMLTY